MFLSLLLVCFLLLALLFLCRCESPRAAVASAAVVFYSLLVAVTEILSHFQAVSVVPTVAAWALTDVALLIGLAVVLRNNPLPAVHFRPSAFHRVEWVLLSMVAFVLLLELAIALVVPPNTWDSMTYHMSRVMHWIQNRSVEFYPSPITQQNHLSPGAEYAILHLQLLSGGDYLANLVQWSCGAVGLVVVSLIVAELGGSSLSQLLAALIGATLPMAILQSTGTQNDLAVSFWILNSSYYLIRLVRCASPRNALLAGLSIGLAMLTKGTAYLFVSPFVAIFLLAVIRSPATHRGEAFRVLYIIGFACLALNGPFYARNCHLHGNPLGAGVEHSNSRITPAIFLYSAARNIALQLATPYDHLNKVVYEGIQGMLGPETDDSSSTWPGYKFAPSSFLIQEDMTGNLLHFVAWVVCLVPLLVWSARVNRLALAYTIATLSAAILFALLLRWQPFAARLHLPLFLVSAAMLGLGLGEWLSRRAALVLAAIFFLCSLPWLFYNQTRPVLGADSVFKTDRISSSFATRKDLLAPYLAAASWIVEHRVSTLGLRFGPDDWEYPLWSLIKAQQDHLPRIVHVQVQDVSESLRRDEPAPDAIVTTTNIESLILKGLTYRRAFTRKPLIILEKVRPTEEREVLQPAD